MTDADMAHRAAVAELELAAKGIPEDVARRTVKGAVSWSVSMAGMLSPDMRARAARQFLEVRLRGAESMCRGIVNARERGDYEEASARAVRDGRYARGLRKFGVEPRPEVVERYAAGQADAMRRY